MTDTADLLIRWPAELPIPAFEGPPGQRRIVEKPQMNEALQYAGHVDPDNLPKIALVEVIEIATACRAWLQSSNFVQPASAGDVLTMTNLVFERSRELYFDRRDAEAAEDEPELPD